MAKETLSWYRPYETVKHGSFKDGDMTWFPEGGESISESCTLRHSSGCRVERQLQLC